MPDVAVVIPLYNGADFISQTIESVLAQTHRPAQVFVIDDGSNDDSRRVVSRYDRVTLLDNPAKGGNHARDFGLSLVETPYVAFLDHDDVWHPRHLELACATLSNHPEAAGVHSNTVAFDHGSAPRFRVVDAPSTTVGHNVWTSFPFAERVSTPSAAVLDAEHVRSCGGWPTWNLEPTDAYMWFRLGIERPYICSGQFTVAYRRRSGSLSSDLREKRDMAMSENHAWLLSHALTLYKESGPNEDVRAFEHRLEAFRLLLQLLDIASTADAGRLRDVAISLHRAVEADASGVLRRDLPKYLEYRMRALLKNSSAIRRSWLQTYAHWPDDAIETRDLLFSIIVLKLLSPSSLLPEVLAEPKLLRPSALPRTAGGAVRAQRSFHFARVMRALKGKRARTLPARFRRTGTV